MKWIPFLLLASLSSTVPVGAVERQVIHDRLSAVRTRLRPLDRLPGQRRLDLALGLPLRNSEALTDLLHQLYDPTSTNYRRYLAPEQFTERFGPTEEDYQAVIAFAKANGLTVTGTHPNRTVLDVQGAISDIEKVFNVKMCIYQHPVEPRTFYAPDVEPSAGLAVPLLTVDGLDNYVIPRPANLRVNPPNAVPCTGSGAYGTYMGWDFRAAYVPGVSLTGAGQVVGLFQLDGYYPNDIAAYETQAGLPNVPLVNVLLNGFSGIPASNSTSVVEVSVDIEMAISMAPGLSKVIVYEGYSPIDILNRMATDDLAKQLSASWLYGESASLDQIYQQFAAQGQSFFQPSGDNGAYYPGIGQWTDDPYITLVGGTVLETAGPAGSWVSETTSSCSGGGISDYYGLPYWQQGINMVTNHGSSTARNAPDVAMPAENIWVVYGNGQSGGVGGTSCSAPLWAGFTALVNQQAVASSSNGTVGFINPALSVIGKGSRYTSCFNDITTGNNTNASMAFFAVPGYDLCTGWGTPRGSNLINSLVGLGAIPNCLLAGVVVSNGTASFVLRGLVGWNYMIDASSNLVNWLPLSTNTIPGPGSLVINDSESTNTSMRFYRARPVGPGTSSAIIAWGDNGDGQINAPLGLSNVVAIAGGSLHSLALKADGTVVGWGAKNTGQTFVPLGLTNVAAIAAGWWHSLALRSDGTVVAWGYNGSGQVNVPAGLTNVVAVAAGGDASFALEADGSLIAWGANWYGQMNIPARLINAVAIAGGDYHALALKADGTVAAWGSDGQQQTNVPTGLSNVVAIAGGASHSLALKADGTAVGWGDNSYNAANGAGLTNVVAIAAGNQFSLALKADGTVVAWGQNDFGQTNVPVGLTNVAAIAAGGYHSLAMLGTGPPNHGLTFQAPSGAITFPFIVTNGYIYQPFETNTLAHEGRAVYSFTLAAAGNYVIRATVSAPNTGADSFYLNIDAEPQDPNMIWDIPLTSGFQQRTVSWRGNGTDTADQFVPKVFSLTQGSHQLIIRGREAKTLLLGCVISKVP